MNGTVNRLTARANHIKTYANIIRIITRGTKTIPLIILFLKAHALFNLSKIFALKKINTTIATLTHSINGIKSKVIMN